MIAKHLANKQRQMNEILNERWGMQGGGVDTSAFVHEIILNMDNDQKIYNRMLSVKTKPEAVAWDVLIYTVNFFFEWYEVPHLKATRTNIRNWFKDNGCEGATDVVIDKLVDHIWEVREESAEWEREQRKKRGDYLDGKGNL